MKEVRAFLDANVLHPAALRNMLMQLTLHGLFQAKWSNIVHEEWIASVLKQRPDLSRAQLERTRGLMDLHAEHALVTDFEELIDGLTLPDPNDRHVLAAAIKCGASIIVTRNLKDFPCHTLAPHKVKAQHPDAFICDLFGLDSAGVLASAHSHRQSLKKPAKTVEEYLDTQERQGLTMTVAKLRDYADMI